MDSANIRRSLVALRMQIPENAFTAETLGTVREGSGVIIQGDRLVLTIGYLMTEAEEVWLTTHDDRLIRGYTLACDHETGLGLVQAFEPLGCPALELGDSASVKVSDEVVAIDGYGQSTTAKIVARKEFAGYWEYLLDDAFFTAPAHPFWGGAAFIDRTGALVGIGSLQMNLVEQGIATLVNMVVPISLLKPMLDDILTTGRIQKRSGPWLGAFSTEINDDVVVLSVADKGPAANAGLKKGDVICDVHGQDVVDLADFYRKIRSCGPAGTEITVGVSREQGETRLKIKSSEVDDFLVKPSLQ